MDWPEKVLFPASCNGWLYALKPQTAMNLLKAANSAPYVFMEDTYITGILRLEKYLLHLKI